jgi:hypothetical protein
MELSRGSKGLLMILPIVLGGGFLALVTTLRGADPVDGRKVSRTPTAERRAGAARLEQMPRRRVPLTLADQSHESGKASVPKGTPPADVLSLEGDPPLGEMAGLWLELNRVLEQKESTPPEIHRQRVIRLTLQFLDLKEPTATAFEAAVSQALAELESAQDDMHRSLEILPADLLDEDLESMKRPIVELYEVRKRSAVTRVLTTLGTGGLHPGFREHLEMWMGYLIPL